MEILQKLYADLFPLWRFPYHCRGCCHGRDRMVVVFTSTYAISAYHHWCCEFESCSGKVYLIQHYVIQVCQWLVTGQWFSLDTPISSTNKTDRPDIIEILLKVALNTITLTPYHCNSLIGIYLKELLPIFNLENFTQKVYTIYASYHFKWNLLKLCILAYYHTRDWHTVSADKRVAVGGRGLCKRGITVQCIITLHVSLLTSEFMCINGILHIDFHWVFFTFFV
jgi:hypothetical protein